MLRRGAGDTPLSLAITSQSDFECQVGGVSSIDDRSRELDMHPLLPELTGMLDKQCQANAVMSDFQCQKSTTEIKWPQQSTENVAITSSSASQCNLLAPAPPSSDAQSQTEAKKSQLSAYPGSKTTATDVHSQTDPAIQTTDIAGQNLSHTDGSECSRKSLISDQRMDIIRAKSTPEIKSTADKSDKSTSVKSVSSQTDFFDRSAAEKTEIVRETMTDNVKTTTVFSQTDLVIPNFLTNLSALGNVWQNCCEDYRKYDGVAPEELHSLDRAGHNMGHGADQLSSTCSDNLGCGAAERRGFDRDGKDPDGSSKHSSPPDNVHTQTVISTVLDADGRHLDVGGKGQVINSESSDAQCQVGPKFKDAQCQ